MGQTLTAGLACTLPVPVHKAAKALHHLVGRLLLALDAVHRQKHLPATRHLRHCHLVLHSPLLKARYMYIEDVDIDEHPARRARPIVPPLTYPAAETTKSAEEANGKRELTSRRSVQACCGALWVRTMIYALQAQRASANVEVRRRLAGRRRLHRESIQSRGSPRFFRLSGAVSSLNFGPFEAQFES